MTLEVSPTERSGGVLGSWQFHRLPARPMFLHRLADLRAIERQIRDAIDRAPSDAVLHFRAAAELRGRADSLLRAAWLRSLAPRTMNITVSFETAATTPTRRELRRAAYAR
jgi:hypothetical protein